MVMRASFQQRVGLPQSDGVSELQDANSLPGNPRAYTALAWRKPSIWRSRVG